MKKDINSILFGSYTLNVDPSGRFVLPAEYRNVLGDNCYIIKGVNCLWLMSTEQFDNIMAEISEKSRSNLGTMFSSRMSVLKRHIFSGMSQCSPETDKNYRITLTPEQRKYADIKNSIKVFGVGDYVEIWSVANWELSKDKADENIVDFAEEIFAPKEVLKEDDLS